MDLKTLLRLKAAGGSPVVNLFDISTLEGKSGITISGDEFSGTAAKINAAGTLALTSSKTELYSPTALYSLIPL